MFMKKFISLHYVNLTESGLTREGMVEVSDVYITPFFVDMVKGRSCARSLVI
jgi:hypothetical protein